jgi:hypothetical protein
MNFSIRQFRASFFDTRAVTSAVDRATRRVLSKFGAFVRTRSRSSIRSRRRISEPGQPPSSHTGLLKRFIYFGYERDRKSVVVGPAKLNKPDPRVLELLEFGGRTRRRNLRTKQLEMQNYRARPFMGPALAKETPKLAPLWRNAVK